MSIWFKMYRMNDSNSWLANLAPYPITYNGQVWRAIAALFQSMRFNDPLIKEIIREDKSPDIPINGTNEMGKILMRLRSVLLANAAHATCKFKISRREIEIAKISVKNFTVQFLTGNKQKLSSR